jgi:protoporphyrinogen/coproporphyrinogen III oxidase
MGTCVVVGGGISGLAAAWELVRERPGTEVTVLEASPRVGGKLLGGRVGGVTVDLGAESVLARRPEAVDLVREVGLGDDLVHPATATASIWSRGRLHPMPARTLMGIPSDVEGLRGLLTDDELERVRAEVASPSDEADVAIGELVARRLGDAVVDRLLEPLLGGVYAGHAREISTAAALPVLLQAHTRGEPLVATAAAALPAPAAGAPSPPVFAGLRGGLHRLAGRLGEELQARGVRIETEVTVRELHRRPGGGFDVVTGPVPWPTAYRTDAVVVALPPAPAARLLGEVAPRAARLLGEVETASMALVTLAYRAADLPVLVGSGVLVPPVEGRPVKAATFSTVKWDWVREAGAAAGPQGEDLVLLRASAGRHREEAVLQRSDPDLVDLAVAELSHLLGTTLPAPLDAHVQRWGGGLPQYAVGHRERVAAVRADVASVPGLAVCGATYDGVGVPACIASGRAAARLAVAAPDPV